MYSISSTNIYQVFCIRGMKIPALVKFAFYEPKHQTPIART